MEVKYKGGGAQGGVRLSVDSTTFSQIFYNIREDTKCTTLQDFLRKIVDSTILLHFNKHFLQSTVFFNISWIVLLLSTTKGVDFFAKSQTSPDEYLNL